MEFAVLRDLLDHFPVGLSVVDRNGYLRYANRRVAELFDFPTELLRPGTDFRKILRIQVARGDLRGDTPEALVERAMGVVLMTAPGAERLEHTLASGRIVEMHRRQQPTGDVLCGYQDVSDRLRTEQALARERALLRSTVDLMPCGVLVSDRDLTFELVNQQVTELFDLPPGLVREGGSFRETVRYQVERGDLGLGDTDERLRITLEQLQEHTEDEAYQRTLANGRSVEIRRRTIDDGRSISIYTDVTERNRAVEALRLAKVELEHTVGQLARANAELIRQTRTDALTGVWNRHYFMERAKEELARFHRQPLARLSVILLDVDHFKRINDRFGHAAGDRVLMQLTEFLQRVLRTQDLFCRVGGEEFAILLPDTQPRGARRLAHRLLAQARQVRLPDGGHVTISAGVTTVKTGDKTIDPALGRADRAMYQAKRAGRDQMAEDADAGGDGLGA